MKKTSLCKPCFSSFQSEIPSLYYRESLRFQETHNAKETAHRIWRHGLYHRVFRFFLHGCLVCVEVSLVRFLYAGTNRSFTYYGSLFLPYTSFARDLILSALSDGAEEAFLVSSDTIHCWKQSLPSPRRTMEHKPAPSPAGDSAL